MKKFWKFVCVDIPKEETETPILMIQTFFLENPKLVVTLCFVLPSSLSDYAHSLSL